MAVQAADPGALDAAVGDQRSGQGQAQLAAVGVAGQQQLEAVGGELVQHGGLGRVQDAQVQVGRRVGRAGDAVVTVAVDVGVVHAGDLDVQVASLDPVA